MVLLASLIAAASLAPALGGVASWQSLPVQKPVPFNAAPLGQRPSGMSAAPPLGGGLSLERLRVEPPKAMENAVTKMGIPLQNMPKTVTWGRDGGHNVPTAKPYKNRRQLPTAPCPGEGRDINGAPAKCNFDETHRMCVKLLDDDGKPLEISDGKSFWDLQRWGWTRPATIAANGGDSSCISMWQFASLASKVGCEKVPLNCAATTLNYVTKRYTELHVFDMYTAKHPLGEIDQIKTLECLESKCAEEFHQRKGALAKNFVKPAAASAWGQDRLISFSIAAATAGAVGAVIATALAWRRREPEMPAELLG